MSLSWTERARRFTAPEEALGVTLGCGRVCAARAARAQGGWRVEEIAEAASPEALFRAPPTPELKRGLTAALGALVMPLKSTFMALHVALPDPLVQLSVFELDELPRTAQARQELARWRFEKELHLDGGAIEVACQDLGIDGGKHLLLAQAADAAWLQCVREALRAAGLTPWSMNAGACYLFNRHHDTLTADGRGGALVALGPDAWALSLWDGAGRLRFVRSRWRESAAEGAETGNIHEFIAREAEVAVRAYVHGGRDRGVGRIYVAGAPQDRDALRGALDARLQEPGISLADEAGAAPEAMASSADGAAVLAAAAAMGSA